MQSDVLVYLILSTMRSLFIVPSRINAGLANTIRTQKLVYHGDQSRVCHEQFGCCNDYDIKVTDKHDIGTNDFKGRVTETLK